MRNSKFFQCFRNQLGQIKLTKNLCQNLQSAMCILYLIIYQNFWETQNKKNKRESENKVHDFFCL